MRTTLSIGKCLVMCICLTSLAAAQDSAPAEPRPASELQTLLALNGLGYEYLRAGETETAIAVFALNVEAYPDEYNPHDSLGEALAAAGQTEEAIKSYARSLALNPGNRNAVVQLDKLTRSEP